jgi:hypothetical protein
MSPLQILEHLRRAPFRAIRIHLSDGSSYEVTHPENAVVTRTEVAIALESPGGDLPERMVYCDPLHVTRIEPIDGTKSESSGTKRKR